MELKIYIDRLKSGQVEKISSEVFPSQLQIEDELEIHFPASVFLHGQTYLTSDHLILRLEIKTKVILPCSICNEPVEYAIHLKDFTHAQPIEEIKSGIFDYTELLREDILLELPQFTECGGKCPQRSILKPFLKLPATEKKTSSSGNFHFPFSELDTQE